MSRQASNHLETLGIDPGASPEEIKRAYLALVKRWHPDRFANDPAQQQIAEDKMRSINVAYETLVGEAQVKIPFQHGSTAPVYDSADPTLNKERSAYAYRERPSGFASWRGQKGWLSWSGTVALSAVSLASVWFVADTLADHYGPPFAADSIRHEAKLQSVFAQTRRAADAGEVWAMVNMGWFNYQGRAARVNKVEAAAWFTRAAQVGDAGAQLQLGSMLARGDGVPANTAMARQWWGRAAANGNAEARSLLERLRQ